ncbi:MAG: thioredoxin domain-containing protein [Rhizomicrobium sp.]|jgi:protein-disulfide isomerase
MNVQWKTAVIGGAIGAAFSLAIVFAFGWFGILPGAGDARIHQYLLAHPNVLVDMSNKLQKQQADEEQQAHRATIAKLGLKRFFDPSVAYVTGPANAKNTFVEFFDYNCIHCRNSLATVMKFYNAHKSDTRFAFIEFPIFGDASTAAARTALAARQQGNLYLTLHFLLMGEKNAIDNDVLFADAKKAGLDMAKLDTALPAPGLELTIAAAHKLAERAKIDGTPTFIINGKVHPGEITDADLKELTKS